MASKMNSGNKNVRLGVKGANKAISAKVSSSDTAKLMRPR